MNYCMNQIPLLLIQHPGGLSRGYGSGWDLVLPKNWGMAFWMSCIYAGAKVIGNSLHYFWRKQLIFLCKVCKRKI